MLKANRKQYIFFCLAKFEACFNFSPPKLSFSTEKPTY